MPFAVLFMLCLAFVGAGCAPIDALLRRTTPPQQEDGRLTPRKQADAQSLTKICLPSETEACATQNPNILIPSIIDWNTATATTEITFSDGPLGIRMRLPFNPAWGDTHYGMTPFEGVDTTSLLFGHVNYYRCAEGCGWTRQYLVIFQPKQDLAQLTAANPKAEITRIKDLTTGEGYRIFIKETDFGGSEESYVLIGPKSNLVFKPGSQTTFTENEKTQLVRVLSTVEFF
ncbi:hypothetical protein KBC54_04345 [Patescibacteria group bacterium]|nr:hypothetical protein [Patescibacteria group bacterium]